MPERLENLTNGKISARMSKAAKGRAEELNTRLAPLSIAAHSCSVRPKRILNLSSKKDKPTSAKILPLIPGVIAQPSRPLAERLLKRYI